MGEFITDLGKNKEIIEKIISKKGYSCNHNFWESKNMEEEGVKPVFYKTENSEGLFASYYKEDNDWELTSDVLAAKERIKQVLYEFAEKIFDKGANKLFIETSPELRKSILKDKRYMISRPSRVYENPIFNLGNFDENLPGKEWKKVRNHINSLIKSHKIEVMDCRDINKEKLLNIINKWADARKSPVSKAWKPVFRNFVKNDFKGCRITRCVVVDREPCSISAGWEIPNSDTYYSAIGVHNYKHSGLGEFAYIDELKELKSQGYKLIDLGGSQKRFLDFKKKFNPEKTYKTMFYWIKKHENT